MASRLYPINDAPALVEKLVGAPAGTAARHAEIEKHYKDMKATLNTFFRLPDTTEEQKDQLRRIHHIIDRDEWETMNQRHEEGQHIANVEHFSLYGWGRVCSPLATEEYGRETDPARVLQMLADQGVTLPDGVTVEDIGGVKWC